MPKTFEPFIVDFLSPCNSYRLFVEDDGKVAYAYLIQVSKDSSIVGDTWLYNRCPTPAIPEWNSRENLPFANPRGYVSKEGHVTKVVCPEDVEWEEEGNQKVAYVCIHGDLYGIVGVGDKPGYARFATKAGPLAKLIEADEGNNDEE